MTDLNTKPAGLLYRPLAQILILALVAVIAYANSFHVPFIFDDEPSITKNDVIHDLANFFTNRSGYDFLPNRYMAMLTFALNYHFSGLNVTGYHVVNLAIHIVNAVLVYTLVRLTFKTPLFETRNPELETRNPELGTRNILPFFAALLFVAHPLQTQAVTYIVQRMTSLATLFYLSALVLHIRWRLANEGGARFFSRVVFPFWLLSLVAAVLAMKTKEIAFTLPLVVLLYEFSFFGRPGRRLVVPLAPLLLTACIIPLTMINLNKPAGQILSDVSSATKAGFVLTRWEYLCTQFSVIVTYLRLLLLPVNQNLDYDYPVNHSLLEPRAFLSLLLLLTLIGLAIWLWYISGRPQSPVPGPRSLLLKSSVPSPESRPLRLASFGILWFFITLAVESSIVPITDVIFEHRVYLPSVGFFLALISLAFYWAGRVENRIQVAGKLVVTALVAATVLLAGTTFARNNVWRSWSAMWQDVKMKSPAKPRAYNNLGAYYVKQEKPLEAIREFEMSVRLDPQYLDSLYNLAMLYVWAGRFREAKQISDTLQKLDPETFKTMDALYGNK
jgi:tetratricopeptide (TPR) repeat protein